MSKKKIIVAVVCFVIGFGIAFSMYSFFRHTIQDVFRFATDDGIQFLGKDFFIFGDLFYHISFGLIFMFFGVANVNEKQADILIHCVVVMLIFSITLIILSSLLANLRIIECTLCDDGIRRLSYNSINYELLLSVSSILSSIPSLIQLFKEQKKLN